MGSSNYSTLQSGFARGPHAAEKPGHVLQLRGSSPSQKVDGLQQPGPSVSLEVALDARRPVLALAVARDDLSPMSGFDARKRRPF